jgi:O-antigen/teichoic acid export membrane protein
MGILCLALVIFAKSLLVFWLGIEFAKAAAALTQVLLVGVFFNSMAHIPLAALQASGRVALTAKLHVVELLLYMPLLLWAVHSQGLMGAAWVWMARTVIDFVFLFGFSLHRHDSSSVSDQG